MFSHVLFVLRYLLPPPTVIFIYFHPQTSNIVQDANRGIFSLCSVAAALKSTSILLFLSPHGSLSHYTGAAIYKYALSSCNASVLKAAWPGIGRLIMETQPHVHI